MIALLAPAALAALAALAVPVLIHLIRRSERKRVDFAALRWLSERTRPRKQLRLHDALLLALRLLLVATLALLLAQPVRPLHGEAGSVWVGVSPALDVAAARAAIDPPLAEWHWLAPGFPSIDTPAPSPSSMSSLIREIDSSLPPETKLSLIVPQQLHGLDAERLRLAHAVDWHALPAQTQAQATAATPALHVVIHAEVGHEDEGRVAEAIVNAWKAGGRELSIDADAVPASTADSLLFWLGGEPDAAAKKWIGNGGIALVSAGSAQGGVALAGDDGVALLREAPLGHGRQFSFAQPLRPAALPALLDPAFPQQLLSLLERHAHTPDAASALSMTPQRLSPLPRGPTLPLDAWFAVFAAALFLLERLAATRARRAA